MNFSDDEEILLNQYQSLSSSLSSLINRVAVEIIPAIIFVSIGLYTGNAVWFIILIIIMVFYNVQRILRQYKNIKKLNSISKKTIGDIHEEKSLHETTEQ